MYPLKVYEEEIKWSWLSCSVCCYEPFRKVIVSSGAHATNSSKSVSFSTRKLTTGVINALFRVWPHCGDRWWRGFENRSELQVLDSGGAHTLWEVSDWAPAGIFSGDLPLGVWHIAAYNLYFKVRPDVHQRVPQVRQSLCDGLSENRKHCPKPDSYMILVLREFLPFFVCQQY